MFFWLKLIRMPNLFTVPGDIMVGFLLTHNLLTLPEFLNLFLLILVSLCLYASGIILNDLLDIEQDKIERPDRPLATGIINYKIALVVAIILIIFSLLLSSLINIYSLIICGIIIILIFLYNGVIRKISPVLGFITMGLCRGMNIILGSSEKLIELPNSVLVVSLIEVCYISIVSAIAYKEAKIIDRNKIGILIRCLILLQICFILLYVSTMWIFVVGLLIFWAISCYLSNKFSMS